MTSQALVGAVGVVQIRVRGGNRAGEVRIVVQGLAHHYLAFCPTSVEVGEQVVVINNRGGRQVDVEPWPTAEFGPDVTAPRTERN